MSLGLRHLARRNISSLTPLRFQRTSLTPLIPGEGWGAPDTDICEVWQENGEREGGLKGVYKDLEE